MGACPVGRLIIAGVIALFAASAFAQTEISGVLELQGMRSSLSGNYLLANDIDASSTENWNELVDAGVWDAGTDYTRVETGEGESGSHARVEHDGKGYYALQSSGPGHGGAVEPGVLPMTGTASAGSGSTAVTGSGTSFTTEFAAGDSIRLGSGASAETGEIAEITDDTNLTVTEEFNDTHEDVAVFLVVPHNDHWRRTELPVGHKLGFEPVGPGNITATRFTGTLDGRGYAITDLYINRPETNYVGIFGYVTGSGAKVFGFSGTGSITGGDLYTGFAAGRLLSSAVSNISVTATVTGVRTVGGIVGYADGGSVRRCRSDGGIYAMENAGGIIGHTWQNTYVEDNVSFAVVTRLEGGTATSFGGLYGNNRRSRLIRNYSAGPVRYEGAADPINRGLVGISSSGGNFMDENNFWDMETSGQSSSAGNATGKTTEEMKDIGTFTDLRTLGLGRKRTGTASAGSGSTAVTGSGTSFTTEFEAGDSIRLGSGAAAEIRVVAIDPVSDTELTVTEAFSATHTDVDVFDVAESDKWDMAPFKNAVINEGYPYHSGEDSPAWLIYVRPALTLFMIH